jgi:hypothetical protein
MNKFADPEDVNYKLVAHAIKGLSTNANEVLKTRHKSKHLLLTLMLRFPC